MNDQIVPVPLTLRQDARLDVCHIVGTWIVVEQADGERFATRETLSGSARSKLESSDGFLDFVPSCSADIWLVINDARYRLYRDTRQRSDIFNRDSLAHDWSPTRTRYGRRFGRIWNQAYVRNRHGKSTVRGQQRNSRHFTRV